MTAPYRLAVIGCGVVSDMHFVGYLAHPERVTVVAACDPLEERRQHVTDAYGITDTYATLDALIASADFDVAIVCTPSHVRVETVAALTAAGKHVMVEKPMADTLDEAREIVRLGDAAGVRIAVDQNFRDHYSFGLARTAIAEGAIGWVVGIDHRELMYREVSGWRAEAKHHSLAVMGVHWFDGFRYLLPEDADWLSARTYRAPAMDAAGETDAFIQIHFGPATVNYTQSFSSRIERVETIVIGEEGTLLVTYDALEIARGDGSREVIQNPCAGSGKPESAYRALARLLDAIEGDRDAENSARDNLKTLSLLHGSYLSAETGEPVTFAEGEL